MVLRQSATCSLDFAELARYLFDQTELMVRWKVLSLEDCLTEIARYREMGAIIVVSCHFPSSKLFVTMFTVNVNELALRNVLFNVRSETILSAVRGRTTLNHSVIARFEVFIELIEGNDFPAARFCIIADEVKF